MKKKHKLVNPILLEKFSILENHWLHLYKTIPLEQYSKRTRIQKLHNTTTSLLGHYASFLAQQPNMSRTITDNIVTDSIVLVKSINDYPENDDIIRYIIRNVYPWLIITKVFALSFQSKAAGIITGGFLHSQIQIWEFCQYSDDEILELITVTPTLILLYQGTNETIISTAALLR